ncbi:hypothetical protein LshimejAT787_1700950 [Lyophyllum shimeji]|uniref:Uncharacterized protein n=1 Tax=Lyophyllum shimeji TaxID=47721 RepID=A0A9P3UTC0_LYOSH|nr:hypothetical protein LshimejAT787_1700950 [Lyophyllum shimeji]
MNGVEHHRTTPLFGKLFLPPDSRITWRFNAADEASSAVKQNLLAYPSPTSTAVGIVLFAVTPLVTICREKPAWRRTCSDKFFGGVLQSTAANCPSERTRTEPCGTSQACCEARKSNKKGQRIRRIRGMTFDLAFSPRTW